MEKLICEAHCQGKKAEARTNGDALPNAYVGVFTKGEGYQIGNKTADAIRTNEIQICAAICISPNVRIRFDDKPCGSDADRKNREVYNVTPYLLRKGFTRITDMRGKEVQQVYTCESEHINSVEYELTFVTLNKIHIVTFQV